MSRVAVRLALVALVLSLVASGAESQRRRRRAPSVREARAIFGEVREAWVALLALEVEPADASGVQRAWDARWADRLEALERLEGSACSVLSHVETNPCSDHEIRALACHGVLDVQFLRRGIGSAPRAGEIDPFEARLVIANEAARREREGLSCEDLPGTYALYRDRCGRWYGGGEGLPVVPGDPPPGTACEDPSTDAGPPGAPSEGSPSTPAEASPPDPGTTAPSGGGSTTSAYVWRVVRVRGDDTAETVVGDGSVPLDMGGASWTCRAAPATSLGDGVRRILSCALGETTVGARLSCDAVRSVASVELLLRSGTEPDVVLRFACAARGEAAP